MCDKLVYDRQVQFLKKAKTSFMVKNRLLPPYSSLPSVAVQLNSQDIVFFPPLLEEALIASGGIHDHMKTAESMFVHLNKWRSLL